MNQLNSKSKLKEAELQSFVYRFRQHKRLFKLTCFLLLNMLGYTLITREFVPFFGFNFISLVAATSILFLGEKQVKQKFGDYFRCQQTGQAMDWKPVVWIMWLIYAVDVMVLYWISVFICTLVFPSYDASVLFLDLPR